MQATTVAAAIGLIWLGIVLGVSFLATPVKFRAQGVSIETGLAIGRVTFESLNAEEFFFAVALLAVTFVGDTQGTVPTCPWLPSWCSSCSCPWSGRCSSRTRIRCCARATAAREARCTISTLGLEIIKVVVLAVGAFALLS
ncbi:hypothetical protein [Dietzia sp.]|uniref:hypothetical protein n=1 Tax=Dietzia sp. TaxID=1871616 RepID=UPI002FD992A9